MRNPKIILAVSNVSMNLGHDGLNKIAGKFGVEFENLQPGDCALFLNTQRDKLKIVGAKGIVLGYLKMPKGQRMPLEAVQYVSQAFSSDGTVNLDKAIRTHVAEKLLKRGKPGDTLEHVSNGDDVSAKRAYKLAQQQATQRRSASTTDTRTTA